MLVKRSMIGAGRLTMLREVTGDNESRREITYAYDDAGNLLSENRRKVGANIRDEIVRYTYDKANRLLKTTTEGKLSEQNTYDLAGNLLSDGEFTYAYDLQNRLITKTGKDGVTRYEYDKSGNLTRQTAPTGVSTYTYTAQNKLQKGENAKGETSEYTYNALGVRVKNVQVRHNWNNGHMNILPDNGSIYLHDYLPALSDNRELWQPTWETEVGTTVQNDYETVTKNYVTDYLSLANRDIMVENEGQYVQRYVYGVDGARLSVQVTYADGTQRGQSGENLASDFAANDVEKVWYRHSLLDSTLLAVDENGEQIVHMSYDAWGVPQTETKLDANFAGLDNLNNFTGYTYDEVLELYFAQNRFYDAQTHRFTQQDPVKDGANWYVYCASNPVLFRDFWGLEKNDNIKNVISKISDLTSLAQKYATDTNQKTSYQEQARLALQFIRRLRYNDNNWEITAGKIDTAFANYVQKNNATLFNYFNENICITGTHSDVDNAFIDLWHFAATANAIIFDSTYASIKSFGVGDDVMNNLAGWAGDLQTLVLDIISDKNYGVKATYSSVYDRAKALLSNPDKASSRFPYSDLLTDADAYNIAKSISSNMSLTDALSQYYENGYKARYTTFVNGLTKQGVRDAALRYTRLKWNLTVTWPIYTSNGLKEISNNISTAVADAFAEIVWKRVKKEGIR